MPNRKGDFLCPKCGEYGFLAKRWVQSSYYPKHASTSCMRLEEEIAKLEKNPNDTTQRKYVEYFRTLVTGSRYRGEEANKLFDRTACYRVFTRKYFKYYVGHYDKERYKEHMKQFQEKKIKSKPNGRRWCGPIKYRPTPWLQV